MRNVWPLGSSQRRVSCWRVRPGFEFGGLPGDLVGQRLAHAADAVHVLDLDLRAEFLLTLGPHGHVAIAAHLALFHVGIADAAIEQDLPQAAQERERLLGRVDFRVRDDFHQRRPGAVEVDAGARVVVKTLGHVLFQMDAHEADFFVGRGDGLLGVLRVRQIVQRHGPAEAQRQVVLRNLVVLGHVRVEVVLAVELALRRDLAVEHQAGEGGQFEGMRVHHRQSARQAEAGRAGVGVGARAELDGAPAEHLGAGLELDVDLQADGRQVFHTQKTKMAENPERSTGSAAGQRSLRPPFSSRFRRDSEARENRPWMAAPRSPTGCRRGRHFSDPHRPTDSSAGRVRRDPRLKWRWRDGCCRDWRRSLCPMSFDTPRHRGRGRDRRTR